MRSLFPLALALALSPAAAAQAPKPETHKDLSYGPHERNVLDLAVPPGKAPRPLVIWIHGGGWEFGAKSSANPAAALLSEGYAVAAINYRYSKQAVFPAQLHDCQAAVRFLRDNAKKYDLDPEAFGAWGASAGGHLAALLGTAGDVAELDGDPKAKTSVKVQAVVDWFGPTDLKKLSPERATGNPVTRLLGGTTGAKAALAAQANPIVHATKNDAPFLIFQGDKDSLVPLEQSELLHKALEAEKVPSELVVIPGAGHGDEAFRKFVGTAETKAKVLAFFDKHLKGKK